MYLITVICVSTFLSPPESLRVNKDAVREYQLLFSTKFPLRVANSIPWTVSMTQRGLHVQLASYSWRWQEQATAAGPRLGRVKTIGWKQSVTEDWSSNRFLFFSPNPLFTTPQEEIYRERRRREGGKRKNLSQVPIYRITRLSNALSSRKGGIKMALEIVSLLPKWWF